MPKIDLRIYKKELRAQMRALRQAMSPALRAEKDRLLFERIIRLPQYKKAHTVICYVSSAVEVDTRRLISYALTHGKRVAVPRCIPGTRLMEMYYIRSLEELKPGSYGILEPSQSAPKCRRWQGTLCIVPSFCVDLQGYRLGYGGGYYDRFLSQYTGASVAINYSECVRKTIEHGRYDVPVQMVLTERHKVSIPSPSEKNRRADPKPHRQ